VCLAFVLTFFFVLLPIHLGVFFYVNWWASGSLEMEAAETRHLFTLPCSFSSSSCFLKHIDFDGSSHARVYGFASPPPLLHGYRETQFQQQASLEPEGYDWYEVHLNRGGRIVCEGESTPGVYFLLFKDHNKLENWMDDGDSTAWWGAWSSKVWVKENMGSGTKLILNTRKDGEIYAAVDNVYKWKDSVGKLSCSIYNKDYDLSNPAWTPPEVMRIPSAPYIYAVANDDVACSASVRWEGDVDYGVVARLWLLPVWGLWTVSMGVLKWRGGYKRKKGVTGLARVQEVEEEDWEEEIEPLVVSAVVVEPSAPPIK